MGDSEQIGAELTKEIGACDGCGKICASSNLINVTDKPDHHDGRYCKQCCEERSWI